MSATTGTVLASWAASTAFSSPVVAMGELATVVVMAGSEWGGELLGLRVALCCCCALAGRSGVLLESVCESAAERISISLIVEANGCCNDSML